MIQAAGTKPLKEYIEKRQAAVAEWVSLWPIFGVCAKDTGYGVGGKLREPWWQQEAVEKQLGDALKIILEAARCRWQQESDKSITKTS